MRDRLKFEAKAGLFVVRALASMLPVKAVLARCPALKRMSAL